MTCMTFRDHDGDDWWYSSVSGFANRLEGESPDSQSKSCVLTLFSLCLRLLPSESVMGFESTTRRRHCHGITRTTHSSHRLHHRLTATLQSIDIMLSNSGHPAILQIYGEAKSHHRNKNTQIGNNKRPRLMAAHYHYVRIPLLFTFQSIGISEDFVRNRRE